ncbi:MAG: hypothetical protein K2X82_30170 [Gemmataceae bacterium]|nr:hypothetical protein [Gemmataceae bacterium]
MTPDELARYQDVQSRALLAPSWGLIVPVRGLSTDPSEVGLAVSHKAMADPFGVDGKTMSVRSCLSDESSPDRSKEILLLDGVDLAGWSKIPLGLFQHNRYAPVSLFQNPQTKQFAVERVGKKLFGTEFFVQSGPMAELAEQVFQLHECKLLQGKSLGFTVNWKDYNRVPDDPSDPYGAATTTIKRCKVFECSSVFIPDNDRAVVTEVVRKGLGSKPLVPALMRELGQFADPAAEWATGWTPPKTEKEAQTVEKTASGCVECGGADMSGSKYKTCTKCVTKMAGECGVKKELSPEAAARVAAADYWDRVVVKEAGLPMPAGGGRPSLKALQAAHDAAMYTAVAALVTLDSVDGPGERTLTEFAGEQQKLAAKCVHAATEIAGSAPDWAGVTPSDVFDNLATPADQFKGVVTRAVEWSVRLKGWSKGAASRVVEGAATLREAASAVSDPALKKALDDRAKALDGLVAEHGGLLPVADRETEEKVKKLADLLGDQEKEIAKLRKRLANAQMGLPVR